MIRAKAPRASQSSLTFDSFPSQQFVAGCSPSMHYTLSAVLLYSALYCRGPKGDASPPCIHNLFTCSFCWARATDRCFGDCGRGGGEGASLVVPYGRLARVVVRLMGAMTTASGADGGLFRWSARIITGATGIQVSSHDRSIVVLVHRWVAGCRCCNHGRHMTLYCFMDKRDNSRLFDENNSWESSQTLNIPILS